MTYDGIICDTGAEAIPEHLFLRFPTASVDVVGQFLYRVVDEKRPHLKHAQMKDLINREPHGTCRICLVKLVPLFPMVNAAAPLFSRFAVHK